MVAVAAPRREGAGGGGGQPLSLSLVVTAAAAGHEDELIRRGPSRTDGDEIAAHVDGGRRRRLVVDAAEGRPLDRPAPPRRRYRMPVVDVDGRPLRRRASAGRDLVGVAFLGDGDHLHPGREQLGGQAPAVVVGRDDEDAAAGHDSVQTHQPLHGGSQHHPRQVIVGEDERQLVGTGGDDDSLRPDLVEAALAARCRRLIADRGQPVVRVPPHHGSPRQRPYAGGLQAGRGRGDGGAVLGVAGVPHMTAGLGFGFDQEHARPLGRRCQRRLQPGRPGADDDDVGVQVLLVVRSGFRLRIDLAQPGRPAQKTLVQRPHRRRSHEGFVVEPDRHEPGRRLDRGEQIVAQRRPRVLRAHRHAGFDDALAGTHVGLVPDLHQAIWAVPGAAEQPARPVVLERAAQHAHPRRRQRRGDRVTRVGLVGLAVKGELDDPRAVDRLPRLRRQALARWLRRARRLSGGCAARAHAPLSHR